MTDLEMLSQIADDRGLRVARRPLGPSTKGLIRGDKIVLRNDLTTVEAADTLAHASPDLITLDLDAAQLALAEITGDTVEEKLLDRVFADFCVGK